MPNVGPSALDLSLMWDVLSQWKLPISPFCSFFVQYPYYEGCVLVFCDSIYRFCTIFFFLKIFYLFTFYIFLYIFLYLISIIIHFFSFFFLSGLFSFGIASDYSY